MKRRDGERIKGKMKRRPENERNDRISPPEGCSENRRCTRESGGRWRHGDGCRTPRAFYESTNLQNRCTSEGTADYCLCSTSRYGLVFGSERVERRHRLLAILIKSGAPGKVGVRGKIKEGKENRAG